MEAELGCILGVEDDISHDDSKPFLVRTEDVEAFNRAVTVDALPSESEMPTVSIKDFPTSILTASPRSTIYLLFRLFSTAVPASREI